GRFDKLVGQVRAWFRLLGREEMISGEPVVDDTVEKEPLGPEDVAFSPMFLGFGTDFEGPTAAAAALEGRVDFAATIIPGQVARGRKHTWRSTRTNRSRKASIKVSGGRGRLSRTEIVPRHNEDASAPSSTAVIENTITADVTSLSSKCNYQFSSGYT